MRRVEQIMGLPISIDIPNCENEAVFKAVFTRFNEIDGRFSTYKPDSEVSRFRDGLVKENSLSIELQTVIAECKKAQAETYGYFSAWAAGAFDPSGYVKGWAIAEAGKIIEKPGYKTYCIGAGGDILAHSNSDKVWQVGIQDPKDKTKILNPSTSLGAGKGVISIKNGAVATSGNYERGSHIINPKTKKPAGELLSVTVTGPDIIKADVLATACFAMGRQKAAEFMKTQTKYQALIV
jgi:thiamine biosynthesis lipoprotein